MSHVEPIRFLATVDAVSTGTVQPLSFGDTVMIKVTKNTMADATKHCITTLSIITRTGVNCYPTHLRCNKSARSVKTFQPLA